MFGGSELKQLGLQDTTTEQTCLSSSKNGMAEYTLQSGRIEEGKEQAESKMKDIWRGNFARCCRILKELRHRRAVTVLQQRIRRWRVQVAIVQLESAYDEVQTPKKVEQHTPNVGTEIRACSSH